MPTIPLYTSKTQPSNDDLFIMEDSVSHSTKKIKRGDILKGTPMPTSSVDSQAIAPGAVTNDKVGDEEIKFAKLYKDYTTTITTTALTPTSKFSMITGLSNSLTINEPDVSLKTALQPIIIRIKCDGTTRAISWNSIYRAVGVTLPTSITANKIYYIAGMWNVSELKVDITAVARQA